MNRSQLEKDIDRQIGNKLQTWLHDSMDLCDMAGISKQHGMCMILYQLIRCLCVGLASTRGTTVDNATELFRSVFIKIQARVEAQHGDPSQR